MVSTKVLQNFLCQTVLVFTLNMIVWEHVGDTQKHGPLSISLSLKVDIGPLKSTDYNSHLLAKLRQFVSTAKLMMLSIQW